MKEEMTVRMIRHRQKPKYTARAAKLLEKCREFYKDPENERAYQEWKARKEEQHEKAAV